jgi:hypothetical protein
MGAKLEEKLSKRIGQKRFSNDNRVSLERPQFHAINKEIYK